MTSAEEKESKRVSKLVAAYNMIPNLIWTVVFLLPVAIFSYEFIDQESVFIILGLSFLPVFFPGSFYNAIELSRNPAFYKRIGVKHINKFAQNGTILSRYLKNKYPTFKTVLTNKSLASKHYHQTYFFEKFHFSLFVFYTIVTVIALIKSYILWAFILSVCNLFYNIYPNLLQQYIRIKLRSAIQKSSS